MKVSILIPTLNRLPYFKESLESARAQIYPDLEILVSDDGSTDGTVEHVTAVAREDGRVRLLPANPHPGLYENYNYLIDHASGDAFGILDDDDRWGRDLVERLVRPLEARGEAVAAFCDHWIISADGARQADQSDENSRLYGRAALPTGPVADPVALTLMGGLSVVFGLFRSSALKSLRFDLSVAGAADLDYAIRAAQHGGELYYVNARLGEYRVYHTRTTSTRTRWMLDGAVKVLEKFQFDGPAHEQQRRERLLAAYRASAIYLSTRDHAECRRIVRAYRTEGGSLAHPDMALASMLALLPAPAGKLTRDLLKRFREKYQRSRIGA